MKVELRRSELGGLLVGLYARKARLYRMDDNHPNKFTWWKRNNRLINKVEKLYYTELDKVPK